MPEVFETQRRVEFRDTDAAGIVHFSVFFAYMEQTEHEMLRHLGLSVVSQWEGKTVSWPRVAASCDYRKAIRFEQIVTVKAWVEKIGNKSIRYGFRFQSTDEPDPQLVAEGSITAACCEIVHGRKPKAIPIPPHFVEKLRPFARSD